MVKRHNLKRRSVIAIILGVMSIFVIMLSHISPETVSEIDRLYGLIGSILAVIMLGDVEHIKKYHVDSIVDDK